MCRIISRNPGTVLRVGTFNYRGMTTEMKKTAVATDMEHFEMEAMFIQETHMKGNGVMDIRSNSGKYFTLYYNGVKVNNAGGTKNVGGVGIFVKNGYKVNFKEITEMICMVTNA